MSFGEDYHHPSEIVVMLPFNNVPDWSDSPHHVLENHILIILYWLSLLNITELATIGMKAFALSRVPNKIL